MKLTKKIKEEIKQVMNDYWDLYFRADLDGWANFLIDDYRNIGSTEEEIWNSKKEIVEYTDRIIHQLEGVVELRNKTLDIISYDPYIMVHEYGDMYFKVENEWTFYQKFRLSSLLQKIDQNWKIFHQHGSFPDTKTQEGEAIGTDALKAENQKLQAAVKKRTTELEQKNRELEIESALQRVRAQVASMEKSEDLLNIVVNMRHEFVNLGHEAGYFWHMRWLPEKYQKAMTSGDGTQIGTVMELPRHIHGEIQVLAEWEQSDEPIVIFPMDVAATLDYVHKMGTWGDFERIDPNMPTDDVVREMGGITYVMARTSLGEIGYSLAGVVESRPQEELDILVRFARTFDLAHKRFEDFKKSEQQAREVQIELALEKVRSRTMAMQKSEELPEAANNLFLQVQELGIPAWSAGYCIWENEEKKSATAFMSSEGVLQKPFSLPTEGVGYNFYKPLQKGESFHIEELGGDELVKHYEFMRTLPIFGEVIDGIMEAGFPLPTFQIFHICYFKYGYVMFITYESVPEAHEIFKRFGKVFEQTYTRFLDLQKAEAQARKAQIEAAMERIRGRALAMHSSEEIMDVMIELRRQIDSLGQLNLEASVVHLYVDGSPTFESIAAVRPPGESGNIVLANVVFPVDATDRIKYMIDLYYSDQNEYTIEFTKEMAEEWQRVMVTHAPMIAERRVGFVKNRRLSSASEFWNFVDFSEGSLLLVTHSPASVDTKEVLRKAANVFDLAYHRYRDLQKAEARAREAQIEAALERVRARSLAMHKSAEMLEVADVLFQQLRSLGGNMWGSGVVICKPDADDDDVWFANENGVLPPISTPHTEDPTHKKMYEGWKNKLEIFSAFKEGQELKEHYDYMLSVPAVKPLFENILASGLSFPTWQKWHAAYFSHGYLLIITLEQYKDEKIFTRFAKVFEQAYTRFLDLQKAEAQAREAEIETALERLRAKAMSMHHSDELDEVLAVLCEQFDVLGIVPMSAHLTVLDIENNKFTFRETGKFGNRSFGEQTVALDAMDTWKEMVESWNNAEPFSINSLHFPKETLPQVWEVFHESFASMPEDSRIMPEDYPDGIYHTAGKHPYGYIGMNQIRKATKEEEGIVVKFANEFGRAYTRFLDLQKAEAQAREAQIELALERVRASAMAMRISDDLIQCTTVVFEELEKLDLTMQRSGIGVFDRETRDCDLWTCAVNSQGEIELATGITSMTIHPMLTTTWDAWIAQEPVSYVLEGEDLLDYYKIISKGNFYLSDEVISTSSALPKEYYYYTPFVAGGLYFFSDTEPLQADKDILGRFAEVFHMTYTRFLDLQKAEAQAREAEIETALERLRAASMAMHHSDELTSTSLVMFQEIVKLGIRPWNFAFFIFHGQSDIADCFASDQTGSLPTMVLPHKPDQFLRKTYEDWRANKTLTVQEAKGRALKKHQEYMKTIPGFDQIIKQRNTAGVKTLKKMIFNNAHFKYGYIMVNTLEPYTDFWDILQRIAKVFEQTYTRFLDLKKAEAQAREARIENALEKVRSRSMAMHKSEELREVIQVVYDQFVQLNLNIEHTGFIMDYKENDDMHIWLADKNAVFPEIQLPYFECAHWNSFKNAKKKGTDIFTNLLGFEEKNKFYQDLFEFIPASPTAVKDHYLSCPGLAISTVLLDNVGLYIENFQGIPYSDEDNAILMRFGKVFQQTYTRFLDLQKAEAQTREAQIEAALEKVRSRSLAMHKSEELRGVVLEVHQKFQELDIAMESRVAVLVVFDEDSQNYNQWVASDDFSNMYISTPYFKHRILDDFWNARQEGVDFYSESYTEDEKNNYFKYFFEISKYTRTAAVEAQAEWIYGQKYYAYSPVFQKNSSVGIADFSGIPLTENEIEIIKRFSKVFEQAYIRFLDLKKAEDQAQITEEQNQKLAESYKNLKATQSQLIQAEKMASLGELTAGIAHEIQNPLNFVNNFSEVSAELVAEAKEELENGEVDEAKELLDDLITNLQKITHHGGRASGIVKGMLAHSRSGEGEKVPTDINELCDEYLRLAYHGLRAKDSSFNAKLETDFDNTIGKIDIIPQDIGRVLLNLITNAFQAIDKDGIVKVSSKKKDGLVNIRVSDNGPGIPNDIKGKIFQPFFTTKPTGSGTGLGLSLAYDIVKAHGGQLSVETEVGKGSTFIIQLLN